VNALEIAKRNVQEFGEGVSELIGWREEQGAEVGECFQPLSTSRASMSAGLLPGIVGHHDRLPGMRQPVSPR